MQTAVRFVGVLVLALWSAVSQGFLITPTHPARVDFTLGTDEVDPGFALPALLISYTVEFNAANGLNLGEGYETATYTANGTFLGSDSYTNTSFGNIIGCACTDVILNAPLNDPHFFALLTSTAGTFEVTDVIALAYDCTNGCGDHARAFGHIHAVPAPPTLPLVLLAVPLVIAASRERLRLTLRRSAPARPE
jgi:hypothetical protein